MAALAVIGTAMSMSQQRRAYKAESIAIQNQASREAEQAKITANERKLERLELLNDALSTTIASSGVSGAGLGGSTYNIIKSDIESYGKEQERDDMATGIQVGGIRASAQNRSQAAKYAGRIGMATTLVSTAAGLS